MHSMSGRSVTVDECTPQTTISELIKKLRERLSDRDNKRTIVLLKNDTFEELTGTTLGDNDITSATELQVIFKDPEMGNYEEDKVKCVNPEPITEKLHNWIETTKIHGRKIFPTAVLKQTSKEEIDCTELVTEHNHWKTGEKCIFFLQMTRTEHFKEWRSDSSTMKGYNGTIQYKSGIELKSQRPNRKPLPPPIHYQYFNSREAERQELLPANMSSIEGILHKIEIDIDLENLQTNEIKYKREFQIYVILKGPITIRDRDGAIKHSSQDPEAKCRVQYDNIKLCNSKSNKNQEIWNTFNASLPDASLPDASLLGGRRAKRTQKKRKAHRRTHKKRA